MNKGLNKSSIHMVRPILTDHVTYLAIFTTFAQILFLKKKKKSPLISILANKTDQTIMLHDLIKIWMVKKQSNSAVKCY